MKSFKIPVEWTMTGFVHIDANSMEEAVKTFDETMDDLPLPENGDYLDSSFARGSSGGGTLQDDIDYYNLFNQTDTKK